MSSLGYASGQLEIEQNLLEQLNRALVAVQAESLGMRGVLNVVDADLHTARLHLGSLAERLVATLTEAIPASELLPIVRRIQGQEGAFRPKADWVDDLRAVAERMRENRTLDATLLRTISDAVQFLDVGFTEELYRLYGRR